jgi:N-acyl-phosphatidylethanolamine-hydrolysing phospholipase D
MNTPDSPQGASDSKGDGLYANRTHATKPRRLSEVLAWKARARKEGHPRPATNPIPMQTPHLESIHQHAQRSAARAEPSLATWIGHSTVLLQSAGINAITDPIFSIRCSPSSLVGPKRHTPAAILPAQLPRMDLVLVSHDHYDHLDEASILALAAQRGGPPTFVVPLGLKAWMSKRGVHSVIELDWWQSHILHTPRGPVETILVPAQHWSGRALSDRHDSLWGGFILATLDAHFFYSGDTGYGPHFNEIASFWADRQTPEMGGGIDLALLPIGAYEPRWFMKNQHMNPADAILAHRDLGTKKSLGIHWGTFTLTDEPLDEPPRRLIQELSTAGLARAVFPTIPIGASLSVPVRAILQG